jgi:hypothetical protein
LPAFDRLCWEATKARRAAEAELIAVQRQRFADSRFLGAHEAVGRWLLERNDAESFARWSAVPINAELGADLPSLVEAYTADLRGKHLAARALCLRNLIDCLRHPIVVFFEFGQRPDNSFRWRGGRYGVLPSQAVVWPADSPGLED